MSFPFSMIIFAEFILEYSGHIHYNVPYRVKMDKLKNRGVYLKLKDGMSVEETKVEKLQLSPIINTQFKNYDIKTVKDLLNFTGGDFTFFRGVGKVAQREIERKIYCLGVDSKTFLSGTVWHLELPDSAKRIFVRNHIIKLEDLKRLDFNDILQMFSSEGHSYVINIITILRNIGIAIGGDKGEMISDIDLPARIKNGFYNENYYFLSQVSHLTDKDFLSIRDLGKESLAEFRKWMAGRGSTYNNV